MRADVKKDDLRLLQELWERSEHKQDRLSDAKPLELT
jgi:hypothetical protein